MVKSLFVEAEFSTWGLGHNIQFLGLLTVGWLKITTVRETLKYIILTTQRRAEPNTKLVLFQVISPSLSNSLVHYTEAACLYLLLTTLLCMPNHFSCVQFFETPWTVALQVPLSMGLSPQEHWSGLPFPPPGDLPNPGIEPWSLMSPALPSEFFTSASWKAVNAYTTFK